MTRAGHPVRNSGDAEKWSHFSAFLHSGYFEWGVMLTILLAAFALRMYGLSHKGLWGDEIFQVRQAQRPLTAILTRSETPEIYDDFVLHFLLLHMVGLVGTNEFWMRVPSVWVSMLALPVTGLLGRKMFGRTAGIGAMLLMAGAPFQIWYAQETRMYAAETFYTALAFYFFVRLTRGWSRAGFVGLTLANTLGLYNHLFTVFPIVVQAGAAVALIAAQLLRLRQVSPRKVSEAKGAAVLVSLGCTFLLTLPLIVGLLPDVGLQVEGGTNAAATVKVDLAFVRDLLMYYGLGADWSWRVMISAGLALVGLVALLRRDRFWVWTIFVFGLPLAVLAVVPLVGNLAHRYMIFMQPLYLTCIAGGAVPVGYKGVKFLAGGSVRREGLATIGVMVAGAAVLGVMLMPPLDALYARAKLNDWRSVVQYVRTNASAQDYIGIEDAAYGVRAYRWYAPEGNVRLSRVPDLVEARRAGRRVWFISFGGYFDAASDEWAQKNLVPLDSTAWEQRDLVYTAKDGFQFPQGETATKVYVSNW